MRFPVLGHVHWVKRPRKAHFQKAERENSDVKTN